MSAFLVSCDLLRNTNQYSGGFGPLSFKNGHGPADIEIEQSE
jgi:hypothetical protein